MKMRFLLLGAMAFTLAACANSNSERSSSSSSSRSRSVDSARYVYNPASSSYEWQRSGDDIPRTGAYQQ